MALAADEYFRAFGDGFADVRLHSLVLLLRYRRSDGGLWIGRIADWKGRHGVNDCSLDCVESALRHEKPRSCGACLTTVQKRDAKSRRDRLLEHGIIEQDVGRLATQLERDALHRRGAVAHDCFANPH
jgi:hypothetical protein